VISLGRRRKLIEKAWEGKSSSKILGWKKMQSAVHRIKVDEEQGLIITTHRHGGLYVTDMDANQNVIWALPRVM
jgi:hypothetical protein